MLETTRGTRPEQDKDVADRAGWSPLCSRNMVLALAECLPLLPAELSKSIAPILVRFAESDLSIAFQKADELMEQVRVCAAASCQPSKALEINRAIEVVRENAGIAVDFATRLIRNDLKGSPAEWIKAALERLISDVAHGIEQIGTISETLKNEIKSAPSIEEMRKRLESDSKQKSSPVVLGEPIANFSKLPNVQENSSAFGPTLGSIKGVAKVIRASPLCPPEKMLLIHTAEIVGKDGGIYTLPRTSQSTIGTLDRSQNSDMILSYAVRSGSASIGSIANYEINGLVGANAVKAQLGRELLAGAQVNDLDLNSKDIQVSYVHTTERAADQMELASEVLAVSGVRTAFSRISATAIEIFSQDTSSDRIHGLCSAFFANDYVYSRDPALGRLFEQIPQHLRFSFLAGLRVGKCSSMSYELQNFLAAAGEASEVESGWSYHSELDAFCAPGHARVRCLREPSVVIDPTIWVDKSKYAIPPSQELADQVLDDLADADEKEAFLIGEQLRVKIVRAKPSQEGSASFEQCGDGHQLDDDLTPDFLGRLLQVTQDPLPAIKSWTKLIEMDLKTDGKQCFLGENWHKSVAVLGWLWSDDMAIRRGQPTIFVDWLLAHLQHPNPDIAKVVNEAFYHSSAFWGPFLPGVPSERLVTYSTPVLKVLAAVQPNEIPGHDLLCLHRFLLQAYTTLPDSISRHDVKDIFTQAAIRSLHCWSNQWKDGDSRSQLAQFMRLLIDLAHDSLSGPWAELLYDAVAATLRADDTDLALRFISGYQRDHFGFESIVRVSPEVQSFFKAQQPLVTLGSVTSLNYRSFLPLWNTFRSKANTLATEILGTEVNVDLVQMDLRSVDSWTSWAQTIHENQKFRFTRAEAEQLTKSSKFFEGIGKLAREQLIDRLENIRVMASNLPDENRQELGSLARQVLAEVIGTNALQLDYPCEMVKLREAIHCSNSGVLQNVRDADMYDKIQELVDLGVLSERELAELCPHAEDLEWVALNVCEELFRWPPLVNQETEWNREVIDVMMELPPPANGTTMTSLVGLMLLSIQDRSDRLPSVWVEFVNAVVELYVSDTLKTVWREASRDHLQTLMSLMGSERDQGLTRPLWKAALLMGDDALRKIVKYSFLVTADDGDYVAQSKRTKEALREAIRIFIPQLRKDSHINACAAVISQVLTGAFTSDSNSNFDRELAHWMNFQKKYRDRPTSKRKYLWQSLSLGGMNHGLPKDLPRISPNLWRSALGASTTRPTSKVLRALLGVTDPFDVRTLKQYTPGDPIEMIDWKTTGRQGQIIIKQPEHVLPVSGREVTVFVDRSDMSITGNELAVNDDFICKLISFVRSLIADGRSPSLVFFAYGVPDLRMSAFEVRNVFLDADGSTAWNELAPKASVVASHCDISPEITRYCPTIASVAEDEVRMMADTSTLILLTSKVATPSAPQKRIWVDRFSKQLQERGKAVRIDV